MVEAKKSWLLHKWRQQRLQISLRTSAIRHKVLKVKYGRLSKSILKHAITVQKQVVRTVNVMKITCKRENKNLKFSTPHRHGTAHAKRKDDITWSTTPLFSIVVATPSMCWWHSPFPGPALHWMIFSIVWRGPVPCTEIALVLWLGSINAINAPKFWTFSRNISLDGVFTCFKNIKY